MRLIQPSRSLSCFQREMRGLAACSRARAWHRKQPNTTNKLRSCGFFFSAHLRWILYFIWLGKRKSSAEENLKIKMEFGAMQKPSRNHLNWGQLHFMYLEHNDPPQDETPHAPIQVGFSCRPSGQQTTNKVCFFLQKQTFTFAVVRINFCWWTEGSSSFSIRFTSHVCIFMLIELKLNTACWKTSAGLSRKHLRDRLTKDSNSASNCTIGSWIKCGFITTCWTPWLLELTLWKLKKDDTDLQMKIDILDNRRRHWALALNKRILPSSSPICCFLLSHYSLLLLISYKLN